MTMCLVVSTKFVRDEEGASLVEYGLLLSLVAVVCIVAISKLGTDISHVHQPGRPDLITPAVIGVPDPLAHA